ncbi:MAG: hypothetical protein OEV42_05865 [Deltaproteobacteria bacterium]|nr:hypothetical protein [Deltaproteobacteria bacterium]
MRSVPRISVVLIPEACELLKNDPISSFLKDNNYFNCESAQQNGNFLEMTISSSQTQMPELEQDTILSIPIHFVLYMISGASRKSFGFEDN